MSEADDIVAGIGKQIAQTTIDATLEITYELIAHTPVDTGFARSMWVPSIGTPSTGEASDVADAEASQAAGQAQVLNFQPAQGSTFVTNNADYIQFLADGSSTQAPAGFVDAAVATGVQTAQGKVNAKVTKL